MPAYPDLPYSYDATVERVDDLVVARASNGAIRARAFFATQPRIFRFRHERLTAAQKATLESFYETNRTASITFSWKTPDPVNYTVLFAPSPWKLRFVFRRGNVWAADVELWEA